MRNQLQRRRRLVVIIHRNISLGLESVRGSFLPDAGCLRQNPDIFRHLSPDPPSAVQKDHPAGQKLRRNRLDPLRLPDGHILTLCPEIDSKHPVQIRRGRDDRLAAGDGSQFPGQGVRPAQVPGQQRNHIASGFIHRQDRRIFRLMLQVRRNGAHGDPDSADIYKGALFPEGRFRPAFEIQVSPGPCGLPAELSGQLLRQRFPPVGKGQEGNSLSHLASLHSRSSVSASAVLPSSP